MGKADRDKAKRVHAIVKATAPDLVPRTWSGMPAYTEDGKPVCFFKPAGKFKMRYATFEFSDNAKLDSGPMWPIGFALAELTDDVEAKIARLVKKAASQPLRAHLRVLKLVAHGRTLRRPLATRARRTAAGRQRGR